MALKEIVIDGWLTAMKFGIDDWHEPDFRMKIEQEIERMTRGFWEWRRVGRYVQFKFKNDADQLLFRMKYC